jgi:hypothetical protein
VFFNGKRGVRLDGFKLQVVDLENGKWTQDDCLVYDETSRELAGIVGRMFWQSEMPRPFGVFYREERPTYDKLLHQQIGAITAKRGKGDLQALLQTGDTWVERNLRTRRRPKISRMNRKARRARRRRQEVPFMDRNPPFGLLALGSQLLAKPMSHELRAKS